MLNLLKQGKNLKKFGPSMLEPDPSHKVAGPGHHIPIDRHLPTADGWKTKTTGSVVETRLTFPNNRKDLETHFRPPAPGERAHAHSTTSAGGGGYQGNTDIQGERVDAHCSPHVDCLPSHLLES